MRESETKRESGSHALPVLLVRLSERGVPTQHRSSRLITRGWRYGCYVRPRPCPLRLTRSTVSSPTVSIRWCVSVSIARPGRSLSPRPSHCGVSASPLSRIADQARLIITRCTSETMASHRAPLRLRPVPPTRPEKNAGPRSRPLMESNRASPRAGSEVGTARQRDDTLTRISDQRRRARLLLSGDDTVGTHASSFGRGGRQHIKPGSKIKPVRLPRILLGIEALTRVTRGGGALAFPFPHWGLRLAQAKTRQPLYRQALVPSRKDQAVIVGKTLYAPSRPWKVQWLAPFTNTHTVCSTLTARLSRWRAGRIELHLLSRAASESRHNLPFFSMRRSLGDLA